MTSIAGSLVAGKEVAIAGAGLAGLAFALSLLQHCKQSGVTPLPKITIFDRDASAEARIGQGYFLTVRSDTGGLQVLHELGVLEDAQEFQELGAALIIADQNFRKLYGVVNPPPPGMSIGRLRISRSRLRQTLLKSFLQTGSGRVVWNKQCSGVMTQQDGAVALTFQDGSEHHCDILIVADGTNSKIRSVLLPSEQPQHAGIVVLAGKTALLNPVPKQLQEGGWLVFSPSGTVLSISTLDKTLVSWSMTWLAPKSVADSLNAEMADPLAAEEVSLLVEEKSKHFGGPWPAVWAATDKTSMHAYSPQQKLPHLSEAPIVYIGDCCHPMSPFSGNGASQAFRDAWQLAKQLTDPANQSLDDAVSGYNAEACPRCSAAMQKGDISTRLFHSTGLVHYLVKALFQFFEFCSWIRDARQRIFAHSKIV